MKLFILNDVHDPETLAMLQAFYSRSHMSIEERYKTLAANSSSIKNALEKYYLGYGHASIADCGFTTIFIEDVSILACKAMQQNPLYNGQEKSTRYLDFSNEQAIDPIATKDSQEVLSGWFTLYHHCYALVIKKLLETEVKPSNVTQTQFETTLNAKAFDICRGLLPAGATTSFSWTGNLRNIREQCLLLKNYPIQEVSNLAGRLLHLLYNYYPKTFKMSDCFNEVDPYTQTNLIQELSHLYLSTTPTIIKHFINHYFEFIESHVPLLNWEHFTENSHFDLIITKRPKGHKLPTSVNHWGTITLNAWLDYGSFRDLQRHRNGTITLPKFHPSSILHPFYVNELSNYIGDFEFSKLLSIQLEKLQRLINNHDEFTCQHYYPLGWVIPVQYTATLPQWIYITELRTQSTVHPTLRKLMLKVAKELTNKGITLHIDTSTPEVNYNRGLQTILEKNNESD